MTRPYDDYGYDRGQVEPDKAVHPKIETASPISGAEGAPEEGKASVSEPATSAPESTPHVVVDTDPRNPHGGSNEDCTGTLCPACGCCMHCIPGACGCTVTDACEDPHCLCPVEA